MLQNQNYIQLLKGIGLSENSAKIYLSLLQNGISAISDLTNYTGLHRVQIYRLIPILIEIGFIFEIIKGKRKFYKPANPEKINLEYAKIFENNKPVIESLKENFNKMEKKTNITLNTGLKGIQNTYNDVVESLEKGETFYRITSELDSEKTNNYYIPKDYKTKRDKKEIQRYIIMTDKTASYKKPKLEREIKIIDGKKEDFTDNIIFTIYANKISFVDFNTETSIIIESQEIAEFQKKIFKLLFKKL